MDAGDTIWVERKPRRGLSVVATTPNESSVGK
jgi:hypothetical protein